MSTTDEQHTGLESADEWANAVTRTLNDQRARTRRFLQRQQIGETVRDLGLAGQRDGDRRLVGVARPVGVRVALLRAQAQRQLDVIEQVVTTGEPFAEERVTPLGDQTFIFQYAVQRTPIEVLRTDIANILLPGIMKSHQTLIHSASVILLQFGRLLPA